jgi:ribosome biogenesis GTPase
MKGIVSKSTGSWYKVLIDGQEVDARLRGKLRTKDLKSTNPIVVGDEVLLEKENNEYVIADYTERTNCIVRRSNKLSKQYQLIAANIDLALLVVSPSNPFTPQGFIDRFLVSAESYHIPVYLVVNKKDVSTKKADKYREYLLNLYADIGYKTLNVSFLDDHDIACIHQLIAGKTILISGNSGVGKSTLINALDPNIQQKTGDISSSYFKGKHTTTFAQMFVIDDFRIIDTPGIKDFGITGLDPQHVSHYFPEMRSALHSCKFNNCIHVNEPKCEVLRLLSEGKINENRYFNYISILEELGITI